MMYEGAGIWHSVKDPLPLEKVQLLDFSVIAGANNENTHGGV
jgi:hypothetical protein